MTNSEIEIKVEPQKISDGWLVFEIDHITVTGSHNYQSVSVTFKPPDYAPLLYAHATMGAGPKPEDTLQVQDLQDFLVAKLMDAHEVIIDAITQAQENKKQENPQQKTSKGW